MRIEVICTGDEVLTGKIVNTNFSYITQKLEDFGLSVSWETTVGDDRESLLLAFQLAGGRADAVIVNGGLGPTVDDLSQEIAAKAAGVELGPARGVAGAHGIVLPAPQPRDAAQQPQAGHAAGRRRDARQPGRHRLRLRGGHRESALLLHAGRAARAAPHAGGAGHPAAAREKRRAARHPPEALPFLRDRGIARRYPACGSGGARRRRNREARIPRALPAARDQADGARRRHGRDRAGRSRPWKRRCASGSATSSWPRTTRRWKASCWRSSRSGTPR